MAFRSDIDLSKLHKSKMDQEMSYGLSWHYNRMLLSQLQQQQRYNAKKDLESKSSKKSNDFNNNFHTKAPEFDDDLLNCLMPHRGKSGTWP